MNEHTGRAASPTEKISLEHPAFAGHFPNDPLLPGVVLLDKLIQRIQKHYASPMASGLNRFCLESVKFLHSVRPDDEISFQWEEQGTQLKFSISCATQLIAQGTLRMLFAEQSTTTSQLT